MKKAKTMGGALAPAVKTPMTADGLENAVAAMGGTRDKLSYNSWEPGRILMPRELEAMFRTSWLAGKIVSIPADDMVREWRTISIGSDDGARKKAFEQAETRLAVRAKVHEALSWARLYGGSLVVIGTRDGLRDPSIPLNVDSIKQGDLRYLQTLDRWRVSPSSIRTKDLSSPNFGLPESYTIAESAVEIHHTRVLRFNGIKLPYWSWIANAMWDDSVLQRVMESLSHRETAVKAVATMMFEANVDVIQGANIAEMLSMKGGEDKLVRRFQAAMMMKSFNRTLLLDASEKYEKKANQFSNLDKVLQEFMTDISGAADIPVTRLFGQSPAGLNSTGEADIRNHYDRISNDQETNLRPQLAYLDEIIYRSTFGQAPKDFTFEFNPLWQMSEKEKADIEFTEAQADQIYIQEGVLDPGMVARELHARRTYSTLTDEDVRMVEELSQAPEPAEPDPADPNDPAKPDPAESQE